MREDSISEYPLPVKRVYALEYGATTQVMMEAGLRYIPSVFVDEVNDPERPGTVNVTILYPYGWEDKRYDTFRSLATLAGKYSQEIGERGISVEDPAFAQQLHDRLLLDARSAAERTRR